MESNKILLYQYGKVGSTSFRKAIPNSTYIHKPLEEYNYRLIQTHEHDVAEDVIKKHPNILVLVIVRLPITRSLSDFWEKFVMKYFLLAFIISASATQLYYSHVCLEEICKPCSIHEFWETSNNSDKIKTLN